MCVSHQHYQACSALPCPSCTPAQTRPHGGQVKWSWICSITWGSSVRKCIGPRVHKFCCGESTGRPTAVSRDRCQWLICVDKNYYKMLIFFNCTKHCIIIFFIEILHLHKFTWGFCFWNHKVQTCDIKLKCDYQEKKIQTKY